MSIKKKTSKAIQNPLNPSPMQPEELKYNTDITPKINPYEYSVEDLRSNVMTVVTTVPNINAYYSWTFDFTLSQEEVQFIYFSNSWSGAITTNEGTYPPFYIVYLDGIKYVKVYYSLIQSPDDVFITLLNSVRVLYSKNVTIVFYSYLRANSGTVDGTMTLSVKTIK